MPRIPSLRVVLVAAATLAAGCTVHETPAPPLTGPSEYAISLSLAADPDLIESNGFSRSTIIVTARDAQGIPIQRSRWLRLDTSVDGRLKDVGTLSERMLSTDSNGRATAIYTAPSASGLFVNRVTIEVTPLGTNAQGARKTTADIRFVLPITPGAPIADFTFNPPSAVAPLADVHFDASGSRPGTTGAPIVRYTWYWDDASPIDDDNGTNPLEEHNWISPGTYWVRLTVTDERGEAASHTEPITVK